MSKLVIVESPAKAKTISRFLGSGYTVDASYGHIRDLPGSAAEIPEEIKGESWARLGVNPDTFVPTYVVPEDKKKHVARLKTALKGAKEVLLATDEDREGESIVWHLIQVLKPKVPVRRIVFHEITPEAIKHAVAHPRDVDENLVKAQESRRIIDRLYGYSLSPVLWKKVQSGLSAGRVQSVAVRMLVQRERERAEFVSAEYWDAAGEVTPDAKTKAFATTLAQVTPALGAIVPKGAGSGDHLDVASGKDFDALTGKLKPGAPVALLDEAKARALVSALQKPNTSLTVTELKETPVQQRPAAPFTTSTLQQEANRKLGFGAQRTMRAAQDLYEGVDLGEGERVGLITYMRTDSTTLSDRALSEAAQVIKKLYGKEYHPGQPTHYKTKSRNAQEAHEAIRPTELGRLPQDMRQFLAPDQAKLYELIWKRTVASQMAPAQLQRTQVRLLADLGSDGGKPRQAVFTSSGKRIMFAGFLRAYVEGSDDPDADLGDQETILPPLKEGQKVALKSIEAKKHETQPPPRFTEATLVKGLEEEGIGRPSTYASIIETIQDRGYVIKQGNALVPTFTAFAVTTLLEKHFAGMVDMKFTSMMEEELDRVAEGELDSRTVVKDFYRGDRKNPGLEPQIAKNVDAIDFPHLPLTKGEPKGATPIIVKVGRYGAYVQRGEGGTGNTASIPDNIAPADLTYTKALEFIEAKAEGPRELGADPDSGLPIVVLNGRFGPYVQVGFDPDAAPKKKKDADDPGPRRASLLPGQTADNVTLQQAIELLSFPRQLGPHPDDKEPVVVNLGRYGPYVKHGATSRSLADGDVPAKITLKRALELLAAPPVRIKRGAGAANGARTSSGRVVGAHPDTGKTLTVRAGRFGPYVSDGAVYANIPKGTDPESVTLQQAADLIDAKASRQASQEASGEAPAKKGRGAKIIPVKPATTKRTTKVAAKKAAAPKKK